MALPWPHACPLQESEGGRCKLKRICDVQVTHTCSAPTVPSTCWVLPLCHRRVTEGETGSGTYSPTTAGRESPSPTVRLTGEHPGQRAARCSALSAWPAASEAAWLHSPLALILRLPGPGDTRGCTSRCLCLRSPELGPEGGEQTCGAPPPAWHAPSDSWRGRSERFLCLFAFLI